MHCVIFSSWKKIIAEKSMSASQRKHIASAEHAQIFSSHLNVNIAHKNYCRTISDINSKCELYELYQTIKFQSQLSPLCQNLTKIHSQRNASIR